MKNVKVKNPIPMPPAAKGPQPYDQFWNTLIKHQQEDWSQNVARKIIKDLPAKWLQEVADSGAKAGEEMELDDDAFELCKFKALRCLWETFYWWNRGPSMGRTVAVTEPCRYSGTASPP